MVIASARRRRSGVANSPGGRPTRLTVPLRRTSCSACRSCRRHGGDQHAVRAATGRLTTCRRRVRVRVHRESAPGDRASASFSSVTSSATTCRPIALAYCTASGRDLRFRRWRSTPRARLGLLDALVRSSRRRRGWAPWRRSRASAAVGRHKPPIRSRTRRSCRSRCSRCCAARSRASPIRSCNTRIPAGVVQPGNTDRVALLQARHAGPKALTSPRPHGRE